MYRKQNAGTLLFSQRTPPLPRMGRSSVFRNCYQHAYIHIGQRWPHWTFPFCACCASLCRESNSHQPTTAQPNAGTNQVSFPRLCSAIQCFASGHATLPGTTSACPQPYKSCHKEMNRAPAMSNHSTNHRAVQRHIPEACADKAGAVCTSVVLFATGDRFCCSCDISWCTDRLLQGSLVCYNFQASTLPTQWTC